jgi:hypothetical protein
MSAKSRSNVRWAIATSALSAAVLIATIYLSATIVRPEPCVRLADGLRVSGVCR